MKKNNIKTYIYLFILFMFYIFSCKREIVKSVEQNSNPIIQYIIATPDSILSTQSSLLYCNAIDIDGDSLNYKWACDSGKFSGAGKSVDWIPPSSSGIYDINCEVSDGKGGVTESEIGIVVTKFDSMAYPGIQLAIPPSGDIEKAYNLRFIIENQIVYNVERGGSGGPYYSTLKVDIPYIQTDFLNFCLFPDTRNEKIVGHTRPNYYGQTFIKLYTASENKTLFLGENASFNDDGSKFVYQKNDSLFIYELDSGETTFLVDSAVFPDWDGNNIVFLHGGYLSFEVYLIKADGTNIRKIPAEPNQYNYPRISSGNIVLCTDNNLRVFDENTLLFKIDDFYGKSIDIYNNRICYVTEDNYGWDRAIWYFEWK